MERKYCVECKRKEATYWDHHYCEECYVQVLNEPKKQQLEPLPTVTAYPRTYQ